MNRCLLICCLFLSIGYLNAQITELGEQVEDVKVYSADGMEGMPIELLDTAFDLTIIDFWSTNCKACIEAFPKVEKLAAKYKGKLRFILVTYEDPNFVSSFFEKRKHYLKKPDLTMVSGDTLLNNLFPHTGNPYYAWIDGQGKVLGLTSSSQVNEKNIELAFAGESIGNKKDIKYEYINSLFDDDLFEFLESYSYIAKAHSYKKIGTGRGIGGTPYFYASNSSILSLYLRAYSESNRFNFKRPQSLILNVKDKARITPPEDVEDLHAWYYDNWYTYDLKVPEHLINKKYDVMKEDLFRYFGIRGKVIIKEIDGYILIKNGDTSTLKTNGGKKVDTFDYTRSAEMGLRKRELKNQEFTLLAKRLQSWVENRLGLPFEDKTGITADVDVELEDTTVDFLSIDGLNEELERYGLQVVRGKVNMPTLVLSE